MNQVFQLQQSDTINPYIIAKDPMRKDSETCLLLRGLMGIRAPKFRQEGFSVEESCILRGIKVLIPVSLREKVLENLHLGNLGIVTMKGLGRRYVYWPGINSHIVNILKESVKGFSCYC